MQVESPYVLKIEDVIVKIEYSENNKTFSECILNILKQKGRKLTNGGKEIKI